MIVALWAWILRAWFWCLTARKGFEMLKSIQAVIAAAFLAIVAAELESEGAGKGDSKKTAAKAKLFTAVDPWLPDWLNPVVKGCADFLIDSLVALANRTGFFGKLAAS